MLTMFRTIKSITRSLEKGRMDVYFVPPTVAVPAKGMHEVWYPLPATPGLTLMAGERLSDIQKDKLGAAAIALDQQTILTMQKVFVSNCQLYR